MIKNQEKFSRPILNPIKGAKGVPIPMIDAVRLIRSSGLFDDAYYVTNYAKYDPMVKLFDPISHFLAVGFERGYLPSPRLDREFHVTRYSEDLSGRLNPLLFLVLHGGAGGKKLGPAQTELYARGTWPRQRAFRHRSMTEFRELVRRQKPIGSPIVDIIMPVYAGYRETLEAIYAVLSSRNKTPFELIVIDDCVPETRLASVLEKLAEIGLFTLVRNNVNLGFVRSVNSRLNFNRSRDVILLNNDTVVYGNWIDRLLAHVKNNVATITPFSNNATLCSYPIIFENNDIPKESTGRQIDSIAVRCSLGKSIEVPTGVGFCFFMARRAIEKVGVFNARTFGAGYGEENDFCLRASAAGFVNLQALDVFVYHAGSISFGSQAEGRKAKNIVKLMRKHETYGQKIRQFAISDPSLTARQAMDFARLTYRSRGRIVLCFTHRLGGGIEHYLKQRAVTRRKEETIIVARPNWPGDSLTFERLDLMVDCPNLRVIPCVGEMPEFGDLLNASSVDHLEVHSLFGYSSDFAWKFPVLSRRINLAYDFYVHDYQTICPRLTLVNDSNLYCGEDGAEQCRVCLDEGKQDLPKVHLDVLEYKRLDIDVWRSMYGAVLEGARSVICPSRDTRNRIQKYFPGLSVLVKPHENHRPSPLCRNVGRSGHARMLRIGVLGGISVAKGALVVADCAKAALLAHYQVEFIIIGHSQLLESLKLPNVRITGRYDDHDVSRHLERSDLDCLFLPSVSPETYLYTLDHCFKTWLPVFVFDLGAQAERIRSYPFGHRLPLSLVEDPFGILGIIKRYVA